MIASLRQRWLRLQAALAEARGRSGSLIFSVWTGLILFGLMFLTLGVLLLYVLIPGDSRFQVGDAVLSGSTLRLQMLAVYVAVLVLMAAVLYLHLVRVVVLPVERMRSMLQQRLSGPAAAQAMLGQQTEVLQLVAQNYRERLEEVQEREQAQQQAQLRLVRRLDEAEARHQAYVAVAEQACIEIDASGKIRSITQAAAALLGLPAATLLGTPLTQGLKLYDSSQARPLEHPLARRISDAAAHGTATPRQLQCLLVNDAGAARSIKLAVLPGGEAARHMTVLRLTPLSGGESLHDGGAALPVQDAVLPDTQALLRRLEDLQRLAGLGHEPRAFALYVTTGIDDEDDPVGTLRNDIATEVGRHLGRSFAGHADVFRIGVSAYGVVSRHGGGEALARTFESARALTQLEITRLHGDRLPLTVRCAAVAIEATAGTAAQLLERASEQLSDKALLMPTATEPRAGANGSSAAGLSRERLQLMGQPVLPTAEGGAVRPWLRICLRLEDNDGHWLEPPQFLPAIEHAGLGESLDIDVLERVVDSSEVHRQLWSSYAGISLGAGVQSLCSDRYLQRAVALVRQHHLPPGSLAVELGQNHASVNMDRLLPGIRMLAAAGIPLIIDGCIDSRVLRVLRQLHPLMIKLSSELLSAARVDPLAQTELQALIAAARVAGARVGATNVGRDDAGAPLAALGIEYQQGAGVEAMRPLLF